MSFIKVQIGARSVTLNEEAFEVFHFNTNWYEHGGRNEYLDTEILEVLNHRNVTINQKDIVAQMRVGQVKEIRIKNAQGHADIYEITRGCGHKNAAGVTCGTSKSCKFCLAKERKEREQQRIAKAKIDAEIRRRRSTPEWKARRIVTLNKRLFGCSNEIKRQTLQTELEKLIAETK